MALQALLLLKSLGAFCMAACCKNKVITCYLIPFHLSLPSIFPLSFHRGQCMLHAEKTCKRTVQNIQLESRCETECNHDCRSAAPVPVHLSQLLQFFLEIRKNINEEIKEKSHTLSILMEFSFFLHSALKPGQNCTARITFLLKMKVPPHVTSNKPTGIYTYGTYS